MEESVNTVDPIDSEQQTQNLLNKIYTSSEARALNPLTLAFIGDAVYSAFVRKYLISQGIQNVNHLTHISVHFVKANAQASALRILDDQLTEEEKGIVRRGRNTRSTPPKNADKMDYRYATGLEALIGFLNLTGQHEREFSLMTKIITFGETHKK
ncbi:MAG: ribonuclease III domain-containing protein [Eubacteriaceae bacterium]|nr:ribonuclease III domain-containing protein [Eubacteriaceae bacterium]MDD4507394.1 ribonuclease III domain-containing protein [Eubacteriaceae bacterium]